MWLLRSSSVIRDVHEFAGMTPTELLASLTPGRHA
jgi:hypothetical protein